MYLDISKVTLASGKTYRRALLRESYRKGGKVCKRTIANISALSDAELRAVKLALAHKDDPAFLGRAEDGPRALGKPAGVAIEQGKAVGAVAAVLAAAEHLGIRDALGRDRQGRLALYQIAARVIGQGSRLGHVRLGQRHALAELLDLARLDEDDLYANLDWLHERQRPIEDALYAGRRGADRRPGLFLYDVTSSYFEGTENALAAFGYNRDGKKGKKQVVAGLLTDHAGTPLSIELFPGNTADPSTVAPQIAKLAERFGGGAVTLVGDRGMLKRPQQQALAEAGMHYLTAITRPQLEGLLRKGTLQLELFEEELAEVTDPATGKRYILRRNPDQAARAARRRDDQLAAWLRLLETRNTYLALHPRATVGAAIRRLDARAATFRLTSWLRAEADGRTLRPAIDEAARTEAARLDGCYVLETDLDDTAATKETLDARYHDLAKVERAFRTSKTGHLEIRPIYLRREERTRAHALVVMLAYIIVRHLGDCWRTFDTTVEDALDELGQLCLARLTIAGDTRAWAIPVPRDSTAALLAAARATLPTPARLRPANVVTRRKLTTRRK